jgi:hypothetical protein
VWLHTKLNTQQFTLRIKFQKEDIIAVDSSFYSSQLQFFFNSSIS